MRKGRTFLAIAFMASGCVHISPAKKTVSPEIQRLTRTIRMQNEWIQNLRDENRVLKSQRQSPSPVAAHSLAAAPKISKPPVAVEEHSENGEHYLYAKILSSYQHHQYAELQKAAALLGKGYPLSTYRDNALYLLGMSEIERGHDLQAEQWLDQVLKECPAGNKVVSALFAKAVLAKRRGQSPQAQQLFHQVMQNYPGSSEAARASTELRLLASEVRHL